MCPIRSQHSLDRLEMVRWESVPWAFPPMLENFRRAFSPGPTYCPLISEDAKLLEYFRATRGAFNAYLQVVITHASHVSSQHSFGLPQQWTQFNHARLDLLSLIIRSRVFWPSVTVTWNLRRAQRWSILSFLTFDRCRPHSVTFGYYEFKNKPEAENLNVWKSVNTAEFMFFTYNKTASTLAIETPIHSKADSLAFMIKNNSRIFSA